MLAQLSIPEEPALHVSMMFWRVFSSQPLIFLLLVEEQTLIWGFTYEITVQAVSSLVTVGENPRRGALFWSPATLELEGIPVNLIEEMRNTDRACWAAVGFRPNHVILVGADTLGWIVAGWEMNIGSQRGSIAITLLIGEANSLSIDVWILNTNTIHTSRSRRINWTFGRARACPLNWHRLSLSRIEDVASGFRWGTSTWVADEHTKALGESCDLLIVALEALSCISRSP